jgi:glycerol transport system ATP-binding protein
MARIELDHIRHAYTDHPASATDYALKDVTHRWEDGGAYALLGPSGCGKTTLLNIISGLIKASEGRILFDGHDVTDLSTQERNIAQVFQFPVVYDTMTVYDNIAFPLRRNTKAGEDEIRERVETLLDQVRLKGEGEKMPADLSGGMKKRAALARALAMDPEVLLVDEPSAGLDPITSEEIDELLERIKDDPGKTLVVVTHNMPSARRLGHELVFLDKGKVLAQGPPDELDDNDNELVRKFLGSVSGG